VERIICVGAGRTNRDAGFILQCREISQRWLVLPARKVLSALESVLEFIQDVLAALNNDPGPEGTLPTFRERKRKLRDTNRGG
jgi:hypothetical protein